MKRIVLLFLAGVALAGCSYKARYYPNGNLAARDVSVMQNYDLNLTIAHGDELPESAFAAQPLVSHTQSEDNYKIPSSWPFPVSLSVRRGDDNTTSAFAAPPRKKNNGRSFVLQERSYNDSTPANGFVRNAGWSVVGYKLARSVGD